MSADKPATLNMAELSWYLTEDSPDNPVNRDLDDMAEEVLAAAIAEAPVAARTVKTRQGFVTPPGFVKSRLRVADARHGDDGELARFVGTRLNSRDGAYPYPEVFFENAAGSTWNRGHKSKRSAINYFLERALARVPYTIYRAE